MPKLVFYSNYLNVHQLPFCEEMLRLLGDDGFAFVAQTPFNKERIASGYEDMNQQSFVIRPYEDERQRAIAEKLALEADVVLMGGDSAFMPKRTSTGRITFIPSERLLKRGLWWRFAPPKMWRTYKWYGRYAGNSNVHILCSSAFTSNDLAYSGFPEGRCWKWGYFPRVYTCEDLGQSYACANKPKDHVSILWVARLIKWKRPYMALRLAERLRAAGSAFHLTIIGDGELRPGLDEYVSTHDLESYVTIKGVLPNNEVHRIMSDSDVFLLTSDRNEGWGAVLNEAMSNSCAVVASSAAGSVPYLVEEGKTGFVFCDGDLNSLYTKAALLVDNPELARTMGKAARKKIAEEWNPCVAAARLLELSECLAQGRVPPYASGPCSHAELIRDDWFIN